MIIKPKHVKYFFPLAIALTSLVSAEDVSTPTYLMKPDSVSSFLSKTGNTQIEEPEFTKDETKKISLLEVLEKVQEKDYIGALKLIDMKMAYTMKHEGENTQKALSLELNIKADILYEMKEYLQAIETSNMSLQLSEPHGFTQEAFSAYSQISLSYEKLGKYAQSITYNNKALEASKKDKALHGQQWLIYLSQSRNYLGLDQVKKAEESLSFSESVTPRNMKPVILVAKAQFYRDTNQSEKAIAAYRITNTFLREEIDNGKIDSGVANNAIRLNTSAMNELIAK